MITATTNWLESLVVKVKVRSVSACAEVLVAESARVEAAGPETKDFPSNGVVDAVVGIEGGTTVST